MTGFDVSVESNIKEVQKQLLRFERKQIPVATQWALNNTAKKVKLAQEREIKRVIDRPTRFTQNSLWIKWAKKNKLIAEVMIKDYAAGGNAAATYLRPVIEGGARRHKGYEKLLISRGKMPGDMYAVPTSLVKKNRFGNVSAGLIQKILSGLGAQRDVYQRARPGSRAHGKYFSGIIGDVYGIWDIAKLRRGGAALLFVFVDGAPKYNKQYNFKRVALKTIDAVFKREFTKTLKRALATAR